MNFAEEQAAIENSTTEQLRETCKGAIGRIIGMMQRPARFGDVDEYNRCRAVAMDCGDELRRRGCIP